MKVSSLNNRGLKSDECYHFLINDYGFLDLEFDFQSDQFWDHNYHAVNAYGNVINNVIPLQPFIQNDIGCIEYEHHMNIHHDYEGVQSFLASNMI